MTKSTKKNNGINRALIYAITALVVFSTLAVVGIYAKYTVGNNAKGYVSAAKFYFTSDILKDTPVTYTLNPGVDGTTSISFELRNYADALRWSDNNISYTVSVSPSDGVEVDDPSGTIAGGGFSRVTVKGLKNGTIYTISVKGEAGYDSTLSATVVVKPDENNIYKHITYDTKKNYLLLTVWTENITGNVNITFPVGLIPDATDTVLYGIESNQVVIDDDNFAAAYSSHVYRFFVTSDEHKNYTEDNFSVKISSAPDTEAIKKSPN